MQFLKEAMTWAGIATTTIPETNNLGATKWLGSTPQMGWNTWNKFGCNVNASMVMD